MNEAVQQCAIELMEVYGIPENLDLNWARLFLKPIGIRRSEDQWIAAVALDRLNHLPGVSQPTWWDLLYFESSLIASMVLVGLCVYATLSSPKRRPDTEKSGIAIRSRGQDDRGSIGPPNP
jgi:hypothetical protein